MSRDRELKECSFHPAVNARPGSVCLSDKSFGDRLYCQTRKKEIVEQLQKEKDERAEEEIKFNCTFKPKICSKNAKARYLEATKEICNARSLAAGQRLQPGKCAMEPAGCTFQPTTNKISKSMKQAREYLRADPYTRLSEQKSQARKMLYLYGGCEDRALLSAAKEEPSTTRANPVQTAERLGEFLGRQSAFELRKEENKQRILDQMQVAPVPLINRDYDTLLLSQSGLRTSKKENSMENVISEYTFHPTILPQSKNLRTRDPSELCYAPLAAKENKIKHLRRGLAQKESHECTFKPRLYESGKYADVLSKLQLTDNIDTYLQRVDIGEKQRENQAKLRQQQREFQETAECTHKPKIRELPSYVANSRQDTGLGKSTMSRDSYYSRMQSKRGSVQP